MFIYDTHLHLTDSRIWPQRKSILEEMRNQNVSLFLNAGVDAEDWDRQYQLKSEGVDFISSIGIHPYVVHRSFLSTESVDLMQERQKLHDKLTSFDAIGETGLDSRPPFRASLPLQKEVFIEHLGLAKKHNKALILHLVGYIDEAISLIKIQRPNVSGIVHSFSGSVAQAKQLIDLGFYLGIGCGILRSQYKKLHQVAQQIPMDFLVLETDSPDQAEKPGQLNYPWQVWQVAEKIAEIQGCSLEQVVKQSNQNFLRLFPGLDQTQTQS